MWFNKGKIEEEIKSQSSDLKHIYRRGEDEWRTNKIKITQIN